MAPLPQRLPADVGEQDHRRFLRHAAHLTYSCGVPARTRIPCTSLPTQIKSFLLKSLHAVPYSRKSIADNKLLDLHIVPEQDIKHS
jgi:hypothetical protein